VCVVPPLIDAATSASSADVAGGVGIAVQRRRLLSNGSGPARILSHIVSFVVVQRFASQITLIEKTPGQYRISRGDATSRDASRRDSDLASAYTAATTNNDEHELTQLQDSIQQRQRSSTAKQWKCMACTLMNQGDALYCAACDMYDARSVVRQSSSV
jgi:hypothetical protein